MRSKLPSILKNKWVFGALAVGAVVYFSKQSSAGVIPQGAIATGPTMKPAAVAKGETVSAQTFQRAQSRRAGYAYAPATMKGNLLTFKAPVRGLFTRNVVQVGTQLLAEIKPQ